MTFVPRPYQTATKAAILAFWAAGKLFPLVIAPTGAGKTEISKMILDDFRSPMAVVHTRPLFQQTARRLPNVRVYTLQSLLAKGPKGDRLRAGLARHDIAFFDEAHHLGGALWRQVLALPTMPKVRFGVTATPMRSDGTALGDFFDCFHVAAKYSELVRDGYLVKCDVVRSDVSRNDQRKHKVRPDGVAFYMKHARREDGSWRPGIHFEVTVEACAAAAARYNEAGIPAAVISEKTTTEERSRIFAARVLGQITVLCSPTVLAEGFDDPGMEVCVLRRSCDNVGDAMQRWGRILRPFPGKTRGLLIDICNVTTKKGTGMPTDDRVYSLEGVGIQLAADVELEEEETELRPAPTPYETIQAGHRLIRDTLLARYRDYQAQADELGYKSGWVWHRFSEATSISPPRRLPATKRHVCVHCRHRMQPGEEVFWHHQSEFYHEECWFKSLDGERLTLASQALEDELELEPRPPEFVQTNEYDFLDELR